ncbi:unnamed protein product [Nesidiocoris tenuis]|uniref:Uncharacterized protein n=1 Tax=Nesidiocoris tenuis TaxID=355587 RepID=A0A6H5GCP6_9HEMI|nr:unnamed protein product [Nesidiocoris tenuis]
MVRECFHHEMVILMMIMMLMVIMKRTTTMMMIMFIDDRFENGGRFQIQIVKHKSHSFHKQEWLRGSHRIKTTVDNSADVRTAVGTIGVRCPSSMRRRRKRRKGRRLRTTLLLPPLPPTAIHYLLLPPITYYGHLHIKTIHDQTNVEEVVMEMGRKTTSTVSFILSSPRTASLLHAGMSICRSLLRSFRVVVEPGCWTPQTTASLSSKIHRNIIHGMPSEQSNLLGSTPTPPRPITAMNFLNHCLNLRYMLSVPSEVSSMGFGDSVMSSRLPVRSSCLRDPLGWDDMMTDLPFHCDTRKIQRHQPPWERVNVNTKGTATFLRLSANTFEQDRLGSTGDARRLRGLRQLEAARCLSAWARMIDLTLTFQYASPSIVRLTFSTVGWHIVADELNKFAGGDLSSSTRLDTDSRPLQVRQ